MQHSKIVGGSTAKRFDTINKVAFDLFFKHVKKFSTLLFFMLH